MNQVFDSNLMPEFFTAPNTEAVDFADVPLAFKFDTYDYDEDKKKHDILEQELRMGVKTQIMAAKELNVDIEELEREKEEALKKQQEIFAQQEKENAQTQSVGNF